MKELHLKSSFSFEKYEKNEIILVTKRRVIISDDLSESLLKNDVRKESMLQISFYVPTEFCDQVKLCMFSAGAGKIGNYDHCAWQTKGRGQFRPLVGSTPFLGEPNTEEFVEEMKVEMVCAPEYLSAVLEALKKSHPYETPAYFVVNLSL